MLKKNSDNPIIKFVSSSKLTVICLFILMILVIWGTLYQAEYGLYQAQQKFFHSWYFLILGFLPFPGTVIVMLILFVNLICALIFRIGFRLSNLGNIFTHLGLVILLIGGGITFYYAEESVLSIKEGEEKNFSTAYHHWELAVWKLTGSIRDVYAIDSDNFQTGDMIKFTKFNFLGVVDEYHKNCQAFGQKDASIESGIMNSSGIVLLKGKESEIEPIRNTPGLVVKINEVDGTEQIILLYGGDPNPTTLELTSGSYFFSLRKAKYLLPFAIKLIDFRMTKHPGTDIAKSYESEVEIITAGFNRQALISMNRPLRHKDYTLFQSSYFVDSKGQEYSILAVVKNYARLFPYISSIVIFFGLISHFLIMLIKKSKKKPMDRE